MRVALVHDYLVRFGGAEQVLLSLHHLFPEAPIYTIIYDRQRMENFFRGVDIRPSYVQRLPHFIRQKYKYFLPLLPTAVETFDLRDFDVVISSSSAFAKGVVVRPKTTHICYCHNPMRFIWDYSQEYLKEQKFGKGKNFLGRLLFHYLRIWDRAASARVDYFLANSQNTADKILKYYQRKAEVLYPPVDTDCGCQIASGKTGDYFLIVSQLAPYKKIDIAVEAFNKLGLPLIIIGDGPERKRLEKLAKANIKFLGFQPTEVVHGHYQQCRAFIFAGEDDFGIAPVEAMAHGKPVIAFRRGGATETIIEGVTGEFFDDLSPEVLADSVRRLLEKAAVYQPSIIRHQAINFSRQKFEERVIDIVDKLRAQASSKSTFP